MMKVRHYVEFAERLGRQEFDKKFEEDVSKYTSESEIQENVFDYFRNETWESNKKYADLLRRAVSKGLVHRVKHKKGRSQFVYFVVPENN